MTTMTALLGAPPLMIGLGSGSELRQPVGYSLVGGLLLSLTLTRRRSSASNSIAATSGFDVGSDPVTGTRKILYASFKGTKRDAEIELARLVSQSTADEGIGPSRAIIAEFIERWHRDWATVNVGPKTAERYLQHLRLYVAPQIGAMRIQGFGLCTSATVYATLLRAGGHKGRALPPALLVMSIESCIGLLAIRQPGASLRKMSRPPSARRPYQMLSLPS